ncbi:MAG: PAS domain S-box protein [Chloroflexi bacterium]|nr:PAS domain S-box protein [Chloroflexota bacterium]
MRVRLHLSKRAHFLIIAVLLVGHSALHYATLLPGGHHVENLPFFDLHMLHEAEYLVVIAYAAYIFRLQGGLLALGASGLASIPFILSSKIHGLDSTETGFSVSGYSYSTPDYTSGGAVSYSYGMDTIKNNAIEVGVLLLIGAVLVVLNELWARERDRRVQTAQRLQAVIDSSPSAIVATGPSGDVRLWNGAAERVFGWSKDQAVGKPVSFALQPNGAATSTYDATATRKDGTRVDIQVSQGELRDAKGQAEGSLYVVNDVTQYRRLEHELQQMQKLDSVGRLAGGVAHDFNNLLTPIIAYSDMAMHSLEPGRPEKEDLGHVVQAAKRAAELTKQLLAFSRRQLLDPQVTDLNEIALEVEHLLRRVIGNNIELTCSLDPQRLLVKVDPVQVQQVLMNLAINARDAMPGRGRLSMTTRLVSFKPDEVQPSVSAETYCAVIVRDNGTGMSEDVKAHLFEPFFTTKEKGKGTGLGLATSLGIIKQSGGHILAESVVGVGTTMTVLLPLAKEEAAKPPTPAPTPIAESKAKETVLVAEDDTDVRALVARSLRDQGYTVIEAIDGEQALDLARLRPFDLLLSDLVMPRLTPVELSAHLKTVRPDIKTLYMTGYADTAFADRLDRSIPLLQKPFTREALLRAVRDALDVTAPIAG